MLKIAGSPFTFNSCVHNKNNEEWRRVSLSITPKRGTRPCSEHIQSDFLDFLGLSCPSAVTLLDLSIVWFVSSPGFLLRKWTLVGQYTICHNQHSWNYSRSISLCPSLFFFFLKKSPNARNLLTNQLSQGLWETVGINMTWLIMTQNKSWGGLWLGAKSCLAGPKITTKTL